MKKFKFLIAPATICFVCSLNANAQKKAEFGKICGNPNVKCRTGDITFQDYEIPFEMPQGNTVIVDSEPFYAVILKSVKLPADGDCENIFSENERLKIQGIFPDNKVFALKCSDAGSLYYTSNPDIADDVNFIAVYAGKTAAEAKNFLKAVQATGKFKGAYLRRMQAGINGT